jgi:release factor glutamine methyltransferase
MTTLLAARRDAVARLAAAGVPDAAQDVAVLLAHALGCDRAGLALRSPQEALSTDQLARLELAVVARAARQPISQITGARLFWGRPFKVTSDVLDPRPETETLIAEALGVPFGSVLDLGTGSGCILVTLLAERPDALGFGVDLSSAALKVAQSNQQRLLPQRQVTWAQGSWFDPVQGQFDLIVSNPPYITADEMADLSAEVRDWEPHLALTPGGDGLAPYRVIAAGAAAFLSVGGWLMVEIGPRQGAAVADLFTAGGFSNVTCIPDLDGRDRVIKGQYLGK